MMVAYTIAQKKEDDHHHQGDGQHQLKLHVGHRGVDGRGQIGQRRYLDGGGQVHFELGQNRLDGLHHADGVGAWLPLNVDDHRRRLVHPSRLIVVLDSVHHLRNIFQHDRRAIAIGNHYLSIVVAGLQLIVGIDLVILMRSPSKLPMA